MTVSCPVETVLPAEGTLRKDGERAPFPEFEESKYQGCYEIRGTYTRTRFSREVLFPEKWLVFMQP